METGAAGSVRRVTPGDDELEALRDEVIRLHQAVRDAEIETGTLRGTIAEMQVQLVRARQDQEQYQRWLTARRAVLDRLSRVKRRVTHRASR